jgi:hypothetical protein
MSDVTQTKKLDLTHRRPSSLSNIQFANTEMSLPSPELPTGAKHVEFSKENMLLRRVQQQQFKRAVSTNVEAPNGRDTLTHRRTQSSVPFGGSGKVS